MIQGDTVRLRPARLEERRMIYAWLAESDITPEMLGPPKFPDAPAPSWEEFCEDYSDEHFAEAGWDMAQCFVIEANGEGVGQVNFDRCHLPRGTAELDIWMRSRADCGRGWGSDALRAMMGWLREAYGVGKFVIRPSARNERAVRAYERAGFARVEMSAAEQERLYGTGDYNDTVVMVRREA